CVDSHVDDPDTSALEILSRFAHPVRWTGVAREVACKRPRTVRNGPTASLWRFLSDRSATAVAIAWRLVPAPIRIRAYQGLAFLGAHMYGSSCSFKVQRLRFGLYLKTTPTRRYRSLANEFAALQLVRRHTNIHVPSALDLARGDYFGPFVDEDDFNNTLRCIPLPNVVHSSGHEIVLTHGDLNMRNIMMHNGRLSGIIDWETCGWFPDYWDYTKAHFITKIHRRWLRIVDAVFEKLGNFEAELAVERQLWWYCY
ncbi:hypothetical protein E4U61_006251, partial [Claviceps capensis]